MRHPEELLGPVALVVTAALLGTLVSISTQTYFTDTLVKVSIVVALYVFIGNSGVLSRVYRFFDAAQLSDSVYPGETERPVQYPCREIPQRSRECEP